MESMLEPVGLGADESVVYQQLLARPRLTAAELGELLGVSAARVRRALTRLGDAGLVTRLASTGPGRYMPARPDLAIDALTLRRQEELEHLRARARELTMAMADPPRGGPADLVELVEGAPAVMHHLSRMQLGASHEVCIVDCPPYLAGSPSDNPEERQALRRGVRYRAIYDATILAVPGRMQEVLEYAAAGEEARSLPDIRLKMIIVDRHTAMIPLGTGESQTGARTLIHRSPLLDILVACFDMLWERATPIAVPGTPTRAARPDAPGPADRSNAGPNGRSGADPTPGQSSGGSAPDRPSVEPSAGTSGDGASGEPSGGGPPADRPGEQDRELLAMLAAGMKDRATARALGVTERTVTRRITQLMRQLGAQTRFQAALQAAKRGWL